MKVTQEKRPASQINLEIEIPGELSKQTYEQTVQKLAREARIPGFRKGKVPRQILIQRMGPLQVKASTLEKLLNESLEKALKQEEIAAIGSYQLHPPFEDLIQQFNPGEAFTFSARVDVMPEVNIKQYQGLTIPVKPVDYDPSKVEAVLENSRKQVATLIPVEDRPAQMGDVAVVDLEGYLEEEGPAGTVQRVSFAGGTVQDMQVSLEAGQLIPGLVEGMAGMNVGQTQDIAALFPQDYPQTKLAGRSAVFSVTLKELKERELPPLSDDFAQEVSQYSTLADLRASLEERYRNEAEQQSFNNLREALYTALLDQLEVELPETLIEEEIRNLINQAFVRLGQQGIDTSQLMTPEVLGRMREEARSDAIVSLKRDLIVAELAQQLSIELTEAEIAQRSQEIVAQFQDPKQVDPKRLLNVVHKALKEEHVFEWLAEHNTIAWLSEDGTTSSRDAEAEGGDEVDSQVAPEADASS